MYGKIIEMTYVKVGELIDVVVLTTLQDFTYESRNLKSISSHIKNSNVGEFG